MLKLYTQNYNYLKGLHKFLIWVLKINLLMGFLMIYNASILESQIYAFSYKQNSYNTHPWTAAAVFKKMDKLHFILGIIK